MGGDPLIGVGSGAALATGAALLAFVLVPAVVRVALRFSIVDQPGGHHGNGRSVPVLGGVAVALSFVTTLGVGVWLDRGLLPPLLQHGAGVGWIGAGAALVLMLGIVDDIRPVSPLTKLLVQLAAAALVLAAGYGFSAITNPFTGGYIKLGFLGSIATVVWIVLITNAFNLIDGLDGLAAGVALIATLTLLGVAAIEGRADAVVLWTVLAGALVGFLPHNFPPARIFLGDSGSLFLGFLIAVLSVQSLQKGATAVVLSVPILTLGLPLSDAAYAVVRRWLLSGASAVVRADRGHIHHRLVGSGFSDRTAVLVLYACCAGFSILAFLAVLARGPLEAALVAIAAGTAFLATRLLDRKVRGADTDPTE